MEFDHVNKFSNDNFDDSINFRHVLDKYLIHIKWFILSSCVFIILAYFQLRTEIPKYQVSSKILIKDKEKGSSVNELGAFEDLGIFGSNNNSLENEILILTSRRLMKNVVNELKLNVRFFIENSPYNLEQYPDFPFTINFPEDTSANDKSFIKKINNISTSFGINVTSINKFEYINSEGVSEGIKEFGKKFKTDKGNIEIDLNDTWVDRVRGKKILVQINRFNAVVDKYNNALVIEPINESRVISLILSETLIPRGVAIINNLIEQYNKDAIEDKNQVYRKTTEFLNDRIVLITSELNAIESTVEQFKTTKGLIDTRSGGDIFLQSSSTNESELITANTQMQLVDYMILELNQNLNNDLLPANIGLEDPSVTALIGEFNNLVLQRNRIIKSSTIRNPLIVNLDSQIIVLKNNMVNSLNSIKSSLLIKINALNEQRGKISSRIAAVPKNEKEYTDIVRQQETKNAVYLYLLQKREESILSNAITLNKARVVDTAYSSGLPVSPKPKVTYFAALLIGLLIPAGIIFIKDALDTKVHDEKDLGNVRMPYIGDVPLAKSKSDILVTDGDNSNVAESFRYIRTNINFMLDNNKTHGKTIFITSTQSGEGKTFTAINLASSLAISGKKTVLIGLDLRAPKITNYLKIKDILGVTNFITDENLTVNDITEIHTNLEHLHIINSGDIPPNPVELLMNKRVNDLFLIIKEKYEYVIVDTAPVGMVTDTIQIGELADLTLYVVKSNYLDKRMLHIPEKLHRENKLKNMAFLINGSDDAKGAYGYGYGYGSKKKKSWYDFFS